MMKATYFSQLCLYWNQSHMLFHPKTWREKKLKVLPHSVAFTVCLKTRHNFFNTPQVHWLTVFNLSSRKWRCSQMSHILNSFKYFLKYSRSHFSEVKKEEQKIRDYSWTNVDCICNIWYQWYPLFSIQVLPKHP